MKLIQGFIIVFGLVAVAGDFVLARRRNRRNAGGCCARCGSRLSSEAAIPIAASHRTNFYCPGCATFEKKLLVAVVAVLLAAAGITALLAFAAHR